MTLRWSRVLAAHEDLLPGDATDHVDGAGVRHASETGMVLRASRRRRGQQAGKWLVARQLPHIAPPHTELEYYTIYFFCLSGCKRGG